MFVTSGVATCMMERVVQLRAHCEDSIPLNLRNVPSAFFKQFEAPCNNNKAAGVDQTVKNVKATEIISQQC